MNAPARRDLDEPFGVRGVRSAASACLTSHRAAERAAPDVARGAWTVEFWQGCVGGLLELAEPVEPDRRTARVHTVERSALVLGSAQRCEIVDRDRTAAGGVELARRRSGGGAVLLAPAAQLWVDFFVPRHDAMWTEDVKRAALWAGELWARCVAAVGEAPVTVHRAGIGADQWGSLVCLAGVAPGEALVDGRKVVGVSQHRNRVRARIQTVARLIPTTSMGAPRRLNEFDFLRLDAAERRRGSDVLHARATGLRSDAAALTSALISSLEPSD